jgi:hypothetical protein
MSAVVSNSEASGALKNIEAQSTFKAMRNAVENSLALHAVQVEITARVISPGSKYPPGSTLSDFQSPDRSESLPRTVVFGASHHGAYIEIGDSTYMTFATQLHCDKFLKTSTSVVPGSATQEAFDTFRWITYVLHASSFSGTRSQVKFATGKDLSGTLTIRHNLVQTATVDYVTPGSSGPPSVSSITEQYTVRYSHFNNVPKIVAPPPADVIFSHGFGSNPTLIYAGTSSNKTLC